MCTLVWLKLEYNTHNFDPYYGSINKLHLIFVNYNKSWLHVTANYCCYKHICLL